MHTFYSRMFCFFHLSSTSTNTVDLFLIIWVQTHINTNTHNPHEIAHTAILLHLLKYQHPTTFLVFITPYYNLYPIPHLMFRRIFITVYKNINHIALDTKNGLNMSQIQHCGKSRKRFCRSKIHTRKKECLLKA